VPGVVVFSKVVWDTLKPQDRLIIRDAARQSVAYQRELLDAYEASAGEKMKKAGAEIISVDPKSFEAALSPVHNELLTSPDLQKLADRIHPPSVADMPDSHRTK